MFADFAYFNRHTMFSRYTPIGIGMIAQYAKQEFGNDIEVSLYKNVDQFFDKAKENPPDIVGFSVYYWNLSINQYAVDRLREMFGQNVIIVLGGPCIDSNEKEQYKFLSKTFKNADAITVNEGEIGFNIIIKKFFENKKNMFNEPIDGVSFLKNDKLMQGRPVGLTLDLNKMGSPYLSGLMDNFMNDDFQPLIQTSRFCPYTCAFCVSGKNRGKIRGFPIEQIREELEYVSKKYADRPHHTMYLADENFGILKRDVEIAQAIKKCNEKFGYPKSVFFYNDKRFTGTSRAVIETLGDINQFGVTLALQTENPETLKAINRRNLTEKEIDDAIAWARSLGLTTTTELIFGLPYETRNNFIDLLNRSVKRGFDTVLLHNLFIMDGIELNRPDVRKKFNIKTKYRPLATHYGEFNNKFVAEYEEVVIESDTFSYEDFLEIRSLNLMFFTVFNQNFQKWFFQFARHLGVNIPDLFSNFVKPDRSIKWPKGYLEYLDDFKNAVEGELHDTKEEVVSKMQKLYRDNGNDVGPPSRINVNFGARLIYMENAWVKPVLMEHLKKTINKELSEEELELANSLISLAERERINLREIKEKESLKFSFDVIDWQKSKYKKPYFISTVLTIRLYTIPHNFKRV